MESKVLAALRRYDMVRPGDTVICAVSGGADSMALLWCMWMLREKLDITVEAAHFNHHLRGEESDRDENHVRAFCEMRDIPLHLGGGQIVAGAKGLEAAAREARYAFLRSLSGTIATAHTADDNAETVLMHLLRGSGLRGLGGITPKTDRLIRPMLDVTREEVEAYVEDNWLRYVTDSSNHSGEFLRNRLRHGVMPLLKQENPRLATSLSAAAQRLRQDEDLLRELTEQVDGGDVEALRRAHPALRRRALEAFLKENGVKEPSSSHILQAESLVFSDNPSARAVFGEKTLTRQYGRLLMTGPEPEPLAARPLPERGEVYLPECDLIIRTAPAEMPVTGPNCFTVSPVGTMSIRGKMSGDAITLPGGTKSLKKLFIDRKIPRIQRPLVPVITDEQGILAVAGIGPDEKRRTGETLIRIEIVKTSRQAVEI